ncbi:MAG TPA: tRNA uridine-5-carboxymethylaminomethyl(34) synthesis enzyme MnmG [Thermomicrobiales bacterium]|nr:tRNA uridine-5-carboxymethylaminomethyl(34) synthesis enzyme MnmG [Thermomicrobiales bacterium]
MTDATLNRQIPTYDVIVIGAGHAGCEAALAAARAGASTLILTPNLDRIGYMPCNPSIGGPAKGHIVAEIDALGGEMAKAIDRTALQIRLLNASKGPAVQALRAQADKTLYCMVMKEALESQPGLELRQESAVRVNVRAVNGSPRVTSVETDFGGVYHCGAAVITAGTFLRGSMIAGEWRSAGGRSGEGADTNLAMSIGDVGIRLRRLKTGTPPRIDARTIDFDLTELQPGSERPLWFSLAGRSGQLERVELPPIVIYPGQTDGWRRQLACFHVETNETGHQLIVDNVDRSPMYNGSINGIGPRYCPSIEDKVMRFRHKTSHGLFLEPEGWRTTEVYVQGANTSLPQDVQLAFLRTIPALRNARITRYGYAVEYDAIEPTELTPAFASKRVDGLFLAGQVNGTSGYEEAAGQGLLAGINAARFVAGADPLVLRRDQAYIGVMADDLTTQEFIEPYRMLTSRAEHRLHLRADNADQRLADIAHAAGLIDDCRHRRIANERHAVSELLNALDAFHVSPNAATNDALGRFDLPTVSRSMTALDYARRPGITLRNLLGALTPLRADLARFATLDEQILSQATIEATYHAYVEKQQQQIDRARRMEVAAIPSDFDYTALPGLRNEAREKLISTRPVTVGQASRIAGVTPSDIAVLLVHVRRLGSGAMMPQSIGEARDRLADDQATVG